MSLKKLGKGEIKVKVNGSLREKDLKMKMRKRMWNLRRILMHLDRGLDQRNNIYPNNNMGVMAWVGWSVGHAVRSILGEISRSTRVVGLRYIVHRRHILLRMFGREFLVLMHLCTFFFHNIW